MSDFYEASTNWRQTSTESKRGKAAGHGPAAWSSPGVFDEQVLHEVHCQGGNTLENVLRIFYVDLRDVEEGFLLSVAQERGHTRQHDIG